MQAILTSLLLPLLLPLVTGYLSTGAMQYLKKLSDTINKLPVWAKPIVVFVLSTAITVAAKSLGITLSTSDLSALSGTDVQSILGALVAIALHLSKKSAEVQAAVAISPTYVDGQKTGPDGVLNPSTPQGK